MLTLGSPQNEVKSNISLTIAGDHDVITNPVPPTSLPPTIGGIAKGGARMLVPWSRRPFVSPSLRGK